MGDKLRPPFKPLAPSQKYRAEGFKGNPEVGFHFAEGRQSSGQPMQDFPGRTKKRLQEALYNTKGKGRL